jgi:hypothetical protein
MPADAVFPASWFVVAFVGLWTLIFIVAYFYARRHGQLADTEQIKSKVFDDGIPNPQPDDEWQRGRAPR